MPMMTDQATVVPVAEATSARPEILVVDDDPISCRLLQKTLSNSGFAVTTAGDGGTALEQIARSAPDLLLLDYKMPGMSGLDVCRAIRNSEESGIREMPVIMLTGHSTEEDELNCWAAGANDFVSKPVSRSALVVRINTQLRLRALSNELRVQNEDLSLWRSEREADLESARSTQQVIVPTDTPAMPGWEIETIYSPVIQVGGDIFGWRPGPGDSWLFWLADATGHGASAALFTTLAAFLFNVGNPNEASPARLLERVNERFYAVFAGHSIMSACCLLLHPDGKARFANAGHPPLLIRRRGGDVEVVTERETMLGIHNQLRFAEAETVIAPGETALMLTDGLYSLFDQQDERMEERAVQNALSGIDGGKVLDPLIEALKGKSKDGAFHDDVAAISMHRVWFPAKDCAD